MNEYEKKLLTDNSDLYFQYLLELYTHLVLLPKNKDIFSLDEALLYVCEELMDDEQKINKPVFKLALLEYQRRIDNGCSYFNLLNEIRFLFMDHVRMEELVRTFNNDYTKMYIWIRMNSNKILNENK